MPDVETDSALDITNNSHQETITVEETLEAQEEGPKFGEAIAIQVVGGLAKQAVEKIDLCQGCRWTYTAAAIAQ